MEAYHPVRDVGAYVELVRDLDEQQFCSVHPYAVLVHATLSSALRPTEDTRGMTVERLVLDGPAEPDAATLDGLMPRATRGGGPAVPGGMYTVYGLASRDPGETTTTIGCSSRSDVQINDQSVSKLHARVVDHGDRYHVQDADSSTGTLVNDEPLEPNQWRRLAAGDRLTLGFVDLTFLPAADFYRFVRRLFVD